MQNTIKWNPLTPTAALLDTETRVVRLSRGADAELSYVRDTTDTYNTTVNVDPYRTHTCSVIGEQLSREGERSGRLIVRVGQELGLVWSYELKRD